MGVYSCSWVLLLSVLAHCVAWLDTRKGSLMQELQTADPRVGSASWHNEWSGRCQSCADYGLQDCVGARQHHSAF